MMFAKVEKSPYHWFSQHKLLAEASASEERAFIWIEIVPDECSGCTGVRCRAEWEQEERYVEA